MAGTNGAKLLSLLVVFPLLIKSEEHCEVANIQITHEDGSQQVFKVKQLQPLRPACMSCQAQAQAGAGPGLEVGWGGEGGDGQPLGLVARQPAPRFPDLVPTVTVVIGGLPAQCDKSREDIPFGLCPEFQQADDSCPGSKPLQPIDEKLLQEYANAIADKGQVPLSTGNKEVDRKLAYGIVLLNTGSTDEALDQFSVVIESHPDVPHRDVPHREDYPSSIAAYHGRGAAYARKGLQHEGNAAEALADFGKAISLDVTVADSYERRGEILMAMGRYSEALHDINSAIKLQPSSRLYFLRGTMHFVTEDLLGAESDFRKCAEMEDHHKVNALYHLGLTLYYSGKVRNAIEVFRDTIREKPDYQEAHTSLAQAYKEAGYLKLAREAFNKSLSVNPNHVMTLQLRATMHYYSGEHNLALQDLSNVVKDLQKLWPSTWSVNKPIVPSYLMMEKCQTPKCLSLDPLNTMCQYMQGLSYVAQGNFYNGVKAATKVMVYQQQPIMKLNPEFIKAHYLREYSRYLHHNLDTNLSDIALDTDLNGEFKDHWAKLLPFTFKGPYREQPGLTPEIQDVHIRSFVDYPPETQQLLCFAEHIGQLTQVSVDGYLENKRLNLAMGLAAIQVAQTMESIWREAKAAKQNESSRFGWRDLFGIAVGFRRLVDPEQPVLWLDMMPDDLLLDGYNSDINFIRGHVSNLRLMHYFDLVFKLMKTMVEHYNGDGVIGYPGMKEDLEKASTCEELLDIAKKRKINQQGFMVSTQVPSIKTKHSMRHEGVILTLASDITGKLIFSINLATTQSRSATYVGELDYIFDQLHQEIRKTGASKIADMDPITNSILSLVYYFYNWMPLSRGSSVVAYSVALGLLMAVGREVTGKIPPGKLVDMEAMLSGAPDAFLLVAKQWMNIKKLHTPITTLPQVSHTLSTVRQVMEVLSISTLTCS